MQEVISPYTIKYTGGLTDEHIINSQELAFSILGASKISTSVIHYIFTGRVPKANYKKEYYCVTKAPQAGSVEWFQWVIPLVPHTVAYTEEFKLGAELLFQAVWDSIVNVLTRNSGKTMADTFLTINRQNNEAFVEMMRISMQAIEKSNRSLSDVATRQSETIEKIVKHHATTMPELAKTNKTNAVNLVQPIGNSCVHINNHFYNGFSVDIDPVKADIIRLKDTDEFGELGRFECIRIWELNLNSGHCILELAGFEKRVPGLITDPVIQRPENAYSTALNEFKPLVLTAKPILRDNEIIKLHIVDARIRYNHT